MWAPFWPSKSLASAAQQCVLMSHGPPIGRTRALSGVDELPIRAAASGAPARSPAAQTSRSILFKELNPPRRCTGWYSPQLLLQLREIALVRRRRRRSRVRTRLPGETRVDACTTGVAPSYVVPERSN